MRLLILHLVMIRIVIPTYNCERTISRCLDAVYASSYRNFEVVVVDDASRDGTIKIVKEYPCQLIECDVNRGAAFARNLGTADCSADYILFIDADVIIGNDTIKELLARATSENVEAVIGCYKKLSLNPSLFSIYHNFFQYFYFFRNTALKLPGSKSSIFWTGCGLVKTKTFRDVGGFCEAIEDASWEDDILGYELTKKGYRIYIDMDIAVFHDHKYNFSQLIVSYFRRAIKMAQTIFISRPDTLLNQGYLNLSNLGALIFAYIFIFVFVASIISGGIFWFMTLFAFISFLLINLNFYFFILRETTFLFTLFSVLINLFCYIVVGAGVFVGTILELKSKLTRIHILHR